MVDISALMRVLPVSRLEPDWVASLGGFIDVPKDRGWQERIRLLEPPAGQRVPYIEPVEALEKLLRRQGVAPRVGLLLPLSLCRDGRRARHCWKFPSHPWLATADSASGPRSRETEVP
jgi:hypothetical protein